MNELDSLISKFKNKKRVLKVPLKKSIKNNILSKILLSIILFLSCLIFINQSSNNSLLVKKYIYTDSLKFNKFKSKYESLFGDAIPKTSKDKAVFSGKLIYNDISNYLDGEKLKVNNNSVISNITSGIVVFIGQKEGYGNTVIIQGIDGADIWYGNLDNVSVKLYDYLESETVLGETKGEYLYLLIKKDNKFIKYEDYKA